MTDAWTVIRRHSKSFSLAARLFPKERRADVAVIYAWCRHCDDAIDLAPREEQPAALGRLRAELDLVFGAETPRDPFLAEVGRVFAEVGVPRSYPEELLAGMQMDLDVDRYATLEDLRLYCHRVAGTVGLMMCHVMGVRSDEALQHATHLGIGMQLTNICRDVEEDWARGRLYVPLELLSPRSRSWVSEARGAAFPEDVERDLASAVHVLLDTADRYYASGDAGLSFLDARSAAAVSAARRIYAAIGDEIRRVGGRPSAGRAVVPTWRKLGHAISALAGRSALARRTAPHAPLRPPSQVLAFAEVPPL